MQNGMYRRVLMARLVSTSTLHHRRNAVVLGLRSTPETFTVRSMCGVNILVNIVLSACHTEMPRIS